MEQQQPTSHFYSSRGLRLHYCEWGDSKLPPLLLIHGMQDHCRTWDGLTECLAGQYRFIAPDLRGHGDSEWSRGSTYHPLDYVYDLVVLIRELKLKQLTLVGHSLGGTVAVILAAVCRAETKQLVSIEGIGLLPDGEDSRTTEEQLQGWIEGLDLLATKRPRRYRDVAAAVGRMRELHTGLSADQAHHLCLHGLRQNDDESFSWKYDNGTLVWPAFGLSSQQQIALWRGVTCPALFINAAQGYDYRTGQNGTLDHFASAEEVVVEDAGHWTYHDQLGDVVEQISQFVQIVR